MRQRNSSNAAIFCACNHKTTISLPHRNQELFNKPLSVIIGVKSHISRVKIAIVFYAMKNLGLRETKLKHVYSCAMHYILVTLVQGINGSRYLFIVQRFIIYGTKCATITNDDRSSYGFERRSKVLHRF